MRTPRRMARRASGFCEAPSANSARTSQSVSQSVSGIFAKIKPAGQTTRIRSHPTSLHTRSSNPAHDIWRCNLRVLDQVIRIQSGTEFPGGGSEQEVTSAPMRMQLQGQSVILTGEPDLLLSLTDARSSLTARRGQHAGD